MNEPCRAVLSFALLLTGCGGGGGGGADSGVGGGLGEQTDQGVGGEPVGQLGGGNGGEPVGGNGGEPVGSNGGGPVGGNGGEPVGGNGGEPVGGAGGEPVGGNGGEPVGGGGGEPVGGAGGAGGEPVGGEGGGGVIPPQRCDAPSLNAGDVGDGTFAIEGSTAGAENARALSCGGDEAPDALYVFVAPAAANWVFSTRVGEGVETFDTVLGVLTDCTDPASEVACKDDTARSTHSTVAVPLAAGETVYIVVDGYPDRSGDFTLAAFIQTELQAGDGCPYDDASATCPEGTICDFQDVGYFCMAVTPVPVGGECEVLNDLGPCEDAAAVCVDPDHDRIYNCLIPPVIEAGGQCVVGDDFNTCAEGSFCADPEVDGTANCLVPGRDVAVCPDAWAPVETLNADGDGPWTIEVNTIGGADRTAGSCGGRDAPEAVVAFTAPVAGEFVARTVAEHDTVLYARSYCTFAEPELACNDDVVFGLKTSEIIANLGADETTYFFVDGYGNDDIGMVTLQVDLVPAM